MRIELFRQISKSTECTTRSVEVIHTSETESEFHPANSEWQIFVPLAISIYDALRFQKPRQTEKEDSPGGNTYNAGFTSLQRMVRGSRWRYVPPTCALVLGCYMTMGLWSGLNSTYICPLVVGEARSIPLMQWLSAMLDSFVAIATYELCLPPTPVGSNFRGRGPAIWSTILVVSCSNAHHLYLTDGMQDGSHYLGGNRHCCVFCKARISSLASAA